MAPARFLQIREIRRQRDASTIQRLYFPEHPTDEERAFSAMLAYVARFYPQGSTPPQRSQATPTPRATSTPAPEAETPFKRPCVRSYGPSGRNEIGSVASLLILAQRSRTTGSFRRSWLEHALESRI
ncbi:hypothetical protein CDL15_Pgr024786 [Punica granatum]|nr:hypothetical protein CDL15_Pgr024786 [Punica granatum]